MRPVDFIVDLAGGRRCQVVMGVDRCTGMWKAHAHVYGQRQGQPTFVVIALMPGFDPGEGRWRGGRDYGSALPLRPLPDGGRGMQKRPARAVGRNRGVSEE